MTLIIADRSTAVHQIADLITQGHTEVGSGVFYNGDFQRRHYDALTGASPGRFASAFPGLIDLSRQALDRKVSTDAYCDIYGLLTLVDLALSSNAGFQVVSSNALFSRSAGGIALNAAVSAIGTFVGQVVLRPDALLNGQQFIEEYVTTATALGGGDMVFASRGSQGEIYLNFPTYSLWGKTLSARSRLWGMPEGSDISLVPLVRGSEEEVGCIRDKREHPIAMEVEDVRFRDVGVDTQASPAHMMIHDMFNHALVMASLRPAEDRMTRCLGKQVLSYPSIDRFPLLKEQGQLLLDYTPRHRPGMGLDQTLLVKSVPSALMAFLDAFYKNVSVGQSTQYVDLTSVKLQQAAKKKAQIIQEVGANIFKHIVEGLLSSHIPMTDLRRQSLKEFLSSWNLISMHIAAYNRGESRSREAGRQAPHFFEDLIGTDDNYYNRKVSF